MPDNCQPRAQVNAGVGAAGNNNASTFTRNNTTGAANDAATRSVENLQRGQQQKAEALRGINDTINATSNPSPMSDSAASPLIRKGASDFARSEAEAGLQRSARALNESLSWIQNATVGQSNWLLNTISSMAQNFLRGTARLEQYLLVHAGSEGTNAGENKAVRDLRAIQPNAVGKFQEWRRSLITPFMQAIHPRARALGMTNREFAELVGHWANWEHAPERNQQILRDWNEELQTELAKGEGADLRLIQDRQQKIQELSAHLNDENPVLADGRRIVSGGFTDGEASAKMREMADRYRLDPTEMSQYAQQLRDIYHAVQSDRISNGFVDPRVMDEFPHFNMYVPYRTDREHITGATNDANIYNPGRFRAMHGIGEGVVTDAFTTIERFMQRAATESAYRDFAFDLLAMQQKSLHDGVDNGVRVYDYNTVVALARSAEPESSNWARNLLNSDNGFAMVLDVPQAAGRGQLTNKRKLITFDQYWQDTQRTGLTGADLNRAFNMHEKRNMWLSALGTATSLRSQLYTRFNFFFAPVNGMRDMWERFTHMSAASYELENGGRVSGSDFLMAYLGNTPRVMSALLGMMDGSLDRSASPMGRWWQEYVRGGLKQEYTPGHDTNQTKLAEALLPQQRTLRQQMLTDQKFKGLQQAMTRLSEGNAGKVLRSIDTWNDYFNNLASFTHYVTLREHGVTEASARQGVLQMMNLYETGTATPFLRAAFPFVKPTLQSAAAMARTFGLAPNAQGKFRPNLKGITMFAGQLAALGVLMPIAKASMGEDEEGRSRYDALNLSDLQRFIPIGINNEGEFAKLPLGFGPMQIASTIVNAYDRIQKGQMTPEEGFVETMVAIGRNIQPAEWPTFAAKEKPVEWLASFLIPDLARPIFETAMNIGYGGSKLTYADPNSSVPMSLQGRKSTEAVYHRMAAGLQQMFGMDLAPEQVKHLVEGYASGPLRLFSEYFKEDSLRAAGIDKTNAQILGPWLSGLGASILHGKVANSNVAQFYREWHKAQQEVKDLGIKITDPDAYKNTEQRIAYQSRLMEAAGMDSDKIAKYFALEAGDKTVRQLSKRLSKQPIEGHWFDEPNHDVMLAAFDDYAERRDIALADALREAGLL